MDFVLFYFYKIFVVTGAAQWFVCSLCARVLSLWEL